MSDLLGVIIEAELGFMALLFVWIIIEHFGGPTMVYYRLRGIERFGHIIIGSNRKPKAHIHRQTDVVEKSPPMFDCQDKMWGYGSESSHCLTSIGDVLVYHKFDDLNPIRFWDFNKGGEIDGSLIKRAWKNNAIERMHNVGRKAPVPWFLILAIGVIAAVMIAVNIYYTHDVACALRARAC
jgi:hypothetical protein